MQQQSLKTVNSDQQAVKPFLRWAGSKRKQLSRLRQFWTPGGRYIEPFVGSACLFFELSPSEAILGDNNAELIEVYRVVCEAPDRLYRRLCRLSRNEETYYRWRRKDPGSLDEETRALRFVFLNRNCFNGIFRTNDDGQFNVPYGRKTGAYFTKSDLQHCSEMLKRANLVEGDFEATTSQAKRGDFVYLDPPFAVQSRRVFREYGHRSFDTADIPRLAKELHRLDGLQAHFLVSYADCTEARQLAKPWNSIRLPIRRHIAGFSDRRRQAYEWLISNMSIPIALSRASA